jgi:hypothetical protein
VFAGPVNHARGGLKTTLHKSLYKKYGHIRRYNTGKCKCYDATVGRYFYALTKIDMFPVDDVVSSSSVQQIINSLAAFSYGHTAACVRCNNRDWESVVLKAKANANQYFDGLCLDCMDRSNPQGKDLDDDYWKHNQNANGRWDSKCRIRHNQSTWYVSRLCRLDIRQKLLDPDGYRADSEEDGRRRKRGRGVVDRSMQQDIGRSTW